MEEGIQGLVSDIFTWKACFYIQDQIGKDSEIQGLEFMGQICVEIKP